LGEGEAQWQTTDFTDSTDRRSPLDSWGNDVGEAEPPRGSIWGSHECSQTASPAVDTQLKEERMNKQRVLWHGARSEVWHAVQSGEERSLCGLVSSRRLPGTGAERPEGHPCLHCQARLRQAQETAREAKEQRVQSLREAMGLAGDRPPRKRKKHNAARPRETDPVRDQAVGRDEEISRAWEILLGQVRGIQETGIGSESFILAVCVVPKG
jgi:hypothetical protein